MTEPEALATLEEQLTGEAGFLARLRGGEGLDYGAVDAVRSALDTLATLWADRTHVPRHALRALVDVSTPILGCREQYPSLAHELVDLAMDLVQRIEDVIYRRPVRMTEEQAAAVIYGELSGKGEGIALRLHHRDTMRDLEWADDLLGALDLLAVAWSTRDEVPKAIVGPMLDARDLIRGHAGNYPQPLQGQLERIGDAVGEAVRRCLA